MQYHAIVLGAGEVEQILGTGLFVLQRAEVDQMLGMLGQCVLVLGMLRPQLVSALYKLVVHLECGATLFATDKRKQTEVWFSALYARREALANL